MRVSKVVLLLLCLSPLASPALVRPENQERSDTQAAEGLGAEGTGAEGSRGEGLQRPELRIIGGSSIMDNNKYPWMAFSDGSFPRCGLAVIHPRWVLTAAHCVLNKWETGFVGPSAGQGIHHHCANTGSRACVDRHPVMIKQHPCFEPCCDVHDIALIKVNQDMPGPYAPVDGLNAHITKDIDQITMMGWGSTCGSGACVPHQLQHLTVATTSDGVCKDKNPTRNGVNEGYCGVKGKCPNLFETGSVFCAGGQQGKDSCNGDSGSPAIFTDPETGEVVVAGVVILGSEVPTEDGKCGAKGRVSVLTKVKSYAWWINRTIELDGNSEVDCDDPLTAGDSEGGGGTVSSAPQPLSPSALSLLLVALLGLGFRV